MPFARFRSRPACAYLVGPHRGRVSRAGAAIVAGAAAVATMAQPAAAAPVAARAHAMLLAHQAAPSLPRGTVVKPQSPKHQLRLTVLLRASHQTALSALVAAVSDPSSPQYHHYLTTGQFGARFGASAATLTGVERELKAAGATIGSLAPNRLSLTVRATASVAARAFHTQIRAARLASGQAAFANTRSAILPAGVTGVVGLDDLAQAHSLEVSAPHTAATLPPTLCAAVGQRTFAYSPAQIASAYGLGTAYSAGLDGRGQTVALMELADYSDADISAYQSCLGLSSQTVERKVVSPQAIGTGTTEVTFDIEQVLATVPSATVLVYEGDNTSQGIFNLYSQMVDDNQAQVISTSWGLCENDNDSNLVREENLLFQQAAAQGQTVLAASGDTGSEDCYGSDHSQSLQVDDPSSQPYVTGVGGTSLTSVTPRTETTWNSGGGSGGGGISTVWPMPTWQQSAVSALSSGTPCGALSGDCREVPDVSASADPSHGYSEYCTAGDCSGAGWRSVGGTSLAAPLWASVVTLADESCASDNHRAGFINPTLYAAPSSAFNDITTGNNDLTGSNGGLYPAGPGYDMATGLGSPVLSRMLTVLCAGSSTSGGSGGATSGGGSSGGSSSVAVVSPSSLTFPVQTVGVAGAPQTVTVTASTGALQITKAAVTGADTGDFSLASDRCSGVDLAVSTSCAVSVTFTPTAAGARTATLALTESLGGTDSVALSGAGVAPSGSTSSSAGGGTTTPPPSSGYRLVGTNGSVFAFGVARLGSPAGHLPAPISAMAALPSGTGYWLASRAGRVYAFGTAPTLGSLTGRHITSPVVGMASTVDGRGYWLVTAAGGVYAFGDAVFHGSAGSLHLAKPIVGLAADPVTGGYWLVASDGGIFSYDAPFLGSTGAIRLSKPIVGMSATPDGRGYRFVASDGGVFSFGSARFLGSLGGRRLGSPVVGMASTSDGKGYWLVEAGGGVSAFGDASFVGSAANPRPLAPVVAITAA
jgi:hypothetical protein